MNENSIGDVDTNCAVAPDGDPADGFSYEEVALPSVPNDGGDVLDEDLDAAMQTLQLFSAAKAESQEPAADTSAGQAHDGEEQAHPVIDDFIRTFLLRMGLERTLDCFDTEWYELSTTGALPGLPAGAQEVPDQYQANLELQGHLAQLTRELEEARKVAGTASATWDRFRKERDFHRMHHKRVLQEKNRLITDIERLKRHYSQYEPAIDQLHQKYETAMKEKMLVRMDRDRLAARVEALETQLRESGPVFQGTAAAPGTPGTPGGSKGSSAPSKGPLKPKPAAAKEALKKTVRPAGNPLPTGCQENPLANTVIPQAPINSFTLQKTFRGHLMAVACVAIHPSKPVVVTGSDDRTWKMWSLPRGDLIMSGEGHSDWLSHVDFHPHGGTGSMLATSSGDASVKIWSLEARACVATLTEHSQAVWGVAWHWQGELLASCSLDHCARLWDLASSRCRQSFKGHVDSINSVSWQPYSGNLCTASTDKTVSVWDARSGLCAQTYYGHTNSCNSAVFNFQGTHIASTGAEGTVKLWDARMVAEVQSTNLGPHAVNKAVFDKSGSLLVVASDSGQIHVVTTGGAGPPDQPSLQLAGHEGEVQAVALSPAGDLLVSGGADHTFRVWS